MLPETENCHLDKSFVAKKQIIPNS